MSSNQTTLDLTGKSVGKQSALAEPQTYQWQHPKLPFMAELNTEDGKHASLSFNDAESGMTTMKQFSRARVCFYEEHTCVVLGDGNPYDTYNINFVEPLGGRPILEINNTVWMVVSPFPQRGESCIRHSRFSGSGQ